MSARCVQTTLRQAHSLWQAGARRQLQTSAIRSAGSHVFHVKDDADFQKQVVDSKKPFIVDFHATWCGPCKVLEPRLEKVLTNYNKNLKDASEDKQIKLAKIDIDQLGELSGQFNVQAVPTVVAIKNGREVSRFTGAADESRIQKMIDQLSR